MHAKRNAFVHTKFCAHTRNHNLDDLFSGSVSMPQSGNRTNQENRKSFHGKPQRWTPVKGQVHVCKDKTKGKSTQFCWPETETETNAELNRIYLINSGSMSIGQVSAK